MLVKILSSLLRPVQSKVDRSPGKRLKGTPTENAFWSLWEGLCLLVKNNPSGTNSSRLYSWCLSTFSFLNLHVYSNLQIPHKCTNFRTTFPLTKHMHYPTLIDNQNQKNGNSSTFFWWHNCWKCRIMALQPSYISSSTPLDSPVVSITPRKTRGDAQSLPNICSDMGNPSILRTGPAKRFTKLLT